jgi:hypothetical protein
LKLVQHPSTVMTAMRDLLSRPACSCAHVKNRMYCAVVVPLACPGCRYTKYVKNLLSIHAAGDNCVLTTRTDDDSGQWILILCNAIGSPVDRWAQSGDRYFSTGGGGGTVRYIVRPPPPPHNLCLSFFVLFVQQIYRH